MPQFVDKEPFEYRPPVGQWSPQNGLGSPETRFIDRKYEKGATEGGPPLFRLTKGQDVQGSFKKAFTKFPEYKEDPWELKIAAARERAAAERGKRFSSLPFKPTTNDLAYRTSKAASPAFTPRYTSSITFRPINMSRAGY